VWVWVDSEAGGAPSNCLWAIWANDGTPRIKRFICGTFYGSRPLYDIYKIKKRDYILDDLVVRRHAGTGQHRNTAQRISCRSVLIGFRLISPLARRISPIPQAALSITCIRTL
jgi:hypothetical protein